MPCDYDGARRAARRETDGRPHRASPTMNRNIFRAQIGGQMVDHLDSFLGVMRTELKVMSEKQRVGADGMVGGRDL